MPHRRPVLDEATPTPSQVVVVRDEQTGQPVDVPRWTGLASAVLSRSDLAGPCELSISFVGADEMAQLNRDHMGGDGATDVLSFPIDGDELTGHDLVDDVPRLLGDVMICPAVAAANAPDHAGSYDDEIALLLVHGILHLLGMDHAEVEDLAAMQARERELLELHHGPLAGDPWSV